MLLTFWTKSMDDEVGTLHCITFRQTDFWNGEVFKAEDCTTMFTMEMDVHVVVDGVVMAVAEFVSGTITAFHKMDKMHLLEKCQGTENA